MSSSRTPDSGRRRVEHAVGGRLPPSDGDELLRRVADDLCGAARDQKEPGQPRDCRQCRRVGVDAGRIAVFHQQVRAARAGRRHHAGIRARRDPVTLISPGFVASEIRRTDNQGAVHANAPDPIPAWLVVPQPRKPRARFCEPSRAGRRRRSSRDTAKCSSRSSGFCRGLSRRDQTPHGAPGRLPRTRQQIIDASRAGPYRSDRS